MSKWETAIEVVSGCFASCVHVTRWCCECETITKQLLIDEYAVECSVCSTIIETNTEDARCNMTTAELLNLIKDKLVTSEVIFLDVNYRFVGVKFWFAHNVYQAVVHGQSVEVWRVDHVNGGMLNDNYSQWVENVLNGKTRNEEGVLS